MWACGAIVRYVREFIIFLRARGAAPHPRAVAGVRCAPRVSSFFSARLSTSLTYGPTLTLTHAGPVHTQCLQLLLHQMYSYVHGTVARALEYSISWGLSGPLLQ